MTKFLPSKLLQYSVLAMLFLMCSSPTAFSQSVVENEHKLIITPNVKGGLFFPVFFALFSYEGSVSFRKQFKADVSYEIKPVFGGLSGLNLFSGDGNVEKIANYGGLVIGRRKHRSRRIIDTNLGLASTFGSDPVLFPIISVGVLTEYEYHKVGYGLGIPYGGYVSVELNLATIFNKSEPSPQRF